MLPDWPSETVKGDHLLAKASHHGSMAAWRQR
jgi:hypothetical protein